MPYSRSIVVCLVACLMILTGNSCEPEEQQDTTPPVVQILQPENQQQVYDKVSIQVSASDNEAVKQVSLLLDNELLPNGTDSEHPYEFTWNTTNLADSSRHILQASAEDFRNNLGWSEKVSCLVDNRDRDPLPVALQTPLNIRKHALTLGWEASIDKDFARYELYRSTSESFDDRAQLIFRSVDDQQIRHIDQGDNWDSTRVSEWGLKENTLYYYCVTVIDTFGRQGESEIVSATTQVSQPVVLRKSVKTTKYTATLKWYLNDEDTRYYRIHRSRSANMGNNLRDSAGFAIPTDSTFCDSGLVPLTAYYYRVFLVDSAFYAVGSNEVQAQTKQLQAVNLLTPYGDDIGKSYIRLQWTKSLEPDENIYQVHRAVGAAVDQQDSIVALIENRADTSYTDNNLAEGQTYSYMVILKDEHGNISSSNSIMVTTLRIQPLDFTPQTIEKYRAVLAWGQYAEDDFVRYALFRSKQKNFDTLSADLKKYISDINTTQYIDSELQLETKYYYQLFVKDTLGYEAGSKLSFQTVGIQPVEIQAVKPVNNDYMQLTYTMNREDNDFAYYAIYRDSATTQVDRDDILAGTVETRSDTVFEDHFQLSEYSDYYYRVYVYDTQGNVSAGSNVKGDTLHSAPDSVTLYFESSSQNAISLRWSQNMNDDFLKYVLYKCTHDNFSKASAAAQKLVEIYDQGTTDYIEQNLFSGEGYFYRLYVFDIGGKWSGSNIVYGYTLP